MSYPAGPVLPPPTELQIQQMTAEIRKTWSARKEVRRRVLKPYSTHEAVDDIEGEVYRDQWGRAIMPVYITEVRWEGD